MQSKRSSRDIHLVQSHCPKLRQTQDRETTLRKSVLAAETGGGSDDTSPALKSKGRASAWKQLSIRLISQV